MYIYRESMYNFICSTYILYMYKYMYIFYVYHEYLINFYNICFYLWERKRADFEIKLGFK